MRTHAEQRMIDTLVHDLNTVDAGFRHTRFNWLKRLQSLAPEHTSWCQQEMDTINTRRAKWGLIPYS